MRTREGIAGFRKFLKKHFTAEELESKFGIEDIDRFDYRLAIKKIPVPIKPTRSLTPAGPSGRELEQLWWKKRIGREIRHGEKLSAETMGDYHGVVGLPLDDEWQWFNRERVRNFHTEVIDRVMAYAAEQGREFHIFMNADPARGHWYLSEKPKIIWGGMWDEYPSARMTSCYKTLRSRNTRFWPGERPGQAMAPRNKPDNQIIETVAAELFVNGMCYRYEVPGKPGEELYSDTLRPVENASLTVTLPSSIPVDQVVAVYYGPEYLPEGKRLRCERSGEHAVTLLVPRVSNWGTVVIGSK